MLIICRLEFLKYYILIHNLCLPEPALGLAWALGTAQLVTFFALCVNTISFTEVLDCELYDRMQSYLASRAFTASACAYPDIPDLI